jgi:hypothetical protein
MFSTPSKMYQRILGFVIVPLLALSNQAHAALEEVTFQAPQVFDPSVPYRQVVRLLWLPCLGTFSSIRRR